VGVGRARDDQQPTLACHVLEAAVHRGEEWVGGIHLDKTDEPPGGWCGGKVAGTAVGQVAELGDVAAVAIGLGFAVLADKLRRTEAVAKSMIFLPMAISFVGAGIVWRFVYSFRVVGSGEQIGILNAAKTGLGGAPVDWLSLVPWNNLFLIVIMIWLQTGFAMVILSSAIKGVSEDMLEAARLDGATEVQVFWRVVVPTIMSSIVVVFTTMVIGVLKVFDIVWVMTGGQNDTEVIAERMIRNFFTFRHFGRGAAVAVFMFLAVIPVMIINVRRFREEEATR
jgi:alpha-glucoside transport system permease protein